MSPLFLEFLMGDRNYECTPWGSPAYNIFGWQRPCYLLQDGYADTFKELLETTKWEEYGVGQRQSQVRQLHGQLRLRAHRCHRWLRLAQRLLGHGQGHFQLYPDQHALKLLNEPDAARPVKSLVTDRTQPEAASLRRPTHDR